LIHGGEDTTSQLIEYASYAAIRSFRQNAGTDITGIYFNKFMSIINHELKESGMNIHMPHCWYLWGDEIVRYAMPDQLRWDHGDQEATRVSWKGAAPALSSRDGEIRDRIDEIIASTLATFPSGNVRQIVDHVYSYAPFSFQREYRKVRISFEDVQGSTIIPKEYGSRRIIPLLRAALSEFPKAEFPEVARKIGPFEEILTTILVEDDSFGLSNEISEEFWSHFCHHLRLHKKGHENVPQGTLQVWREAREWNDHTYSMSLSDHALGLVEAGQDVSGILSGMAERRREELKEFDSIVDRFTA
jgi:hypothetical protein